MRIISVGRLREYWLRHSGTEGPLQAWIQVAKHTVWSNFAELRQTFPSADQVGRLTVFNIKGNAYRLVTRVEYAKRAIYIRWIGTHADYDKGSWKNDPWF